MINETRQTWTPFVFAAGQGDLNVTYPPNLQLGTWGQSGSIIRFGCDVTFTPNYTTAAGTLFIGGLPSLPVITDAPMWGGQMRFLIPTWPTGATQIVPALNVQANPLPAFNFIALGSGFSPTALAITAFPSGGQTRLVFSLDAVIQS